MDVSTVILKGIHLAIPRAFRWRRRAVCMRGVALIAFATCGMVACQMDKASFVPITDAHQLLASIHLETRAYNLAVTPPYNRAQLHVAALLADGTVPDLKVTYRILGNDTAITVDTAGWLTARAPTGSPITVRVSMTAAGVTLSDSAAVSVTDAAPAAQAKRVTIAPPPGDSAVQTFFYLDVIPSITSSKSLSYGVYDIHNSPMPLTVGFASSDTSVAIVDNNGVVRALRPGKTWISISTSAYGQAFRDSLEYRVDSLHFYIVKAAPVITVSSSDTLQETQFFPKELTVPVGSDVSFKADDREYQCDATGNICHSVAETDVIFEDSTVADSSVHVPVNPFSGFNDHGGWGNIPRIRGSVNQLTGEILAGAESRLFQRRGRFPFHNSSGGQGVIIVQ